MVCHSTSMANAAVWLVVWQ